LNLLACGAMALILSTATLADWEPTTLMRYVFDSQEQRFKGCGFNEPYLIPFSCSELHLPMLGSTECLNGFGSTQR
jgi:hypothetical protein